jgi:hypothetical protein
MSLFLNARYNQFRFLFPKGFLYKDIENTYEKYLKDLPTPYTNVLSFLNSTVQSISFPGVSGIQTVDQVQAGRIVSYRQGFRFAQVVNKEFTVTFRLVDAYLNYWLMYEQLVRYTNFAVEQDESDQEFLPDFSILYLTSSGNLTVLQKLIQVVYTGIGDLTPSYTEISNNTKTFSCTFKYNYFELQVHPMEYSENSINIYH